MKLSGSCRAVGWPFWPATVAGLAGLFALDALLAPRGKSCVCRATSAPQLHPGEPADASLTIALPSARRLAVELVVDVNELLDPPPPLRAQVVAGRAVVRCPLRARRRGQALLERAWIRYRGPLGLAVQVVQVELRHEIPVVPNVRPVQKAALRFFRDRNFRAGLKIERHRGDGTEFDSLKDFVLGCASHSHFVNGAVIAIDDGTSL